MSDDDAASAPDRAPAPPITRRRWVGFAGGLVFGTGLSVLLITYGKIALGTWPPVVIPAIGALAGTIWSRWGPIRTIGTAPVVGSPEADQRVEAAMRANLEAIRRGERKADAPPPDPSTAVPDAIGPPESGGWKGGRPAGDEPAPETGSAPGPTAAPDAEVTSAPEPAPTADPAAGPAATPAPPEPADEPRAGPLPERDPPEAPPPPPPRPPTAGA